MFASRPNVLKRLALNPFVRTRAAGSQILLTFDDGPHPEHTPAVLERLQRFNLAAAFFLVGDRIDSAPELPQRIASAGHTLGNHTFTHRRFGWSDLASSLADVRECQRRIPESRLLRPPFGRLTPGLWLAAKRMGLTCMNWSLDSGDWKCRSANDAEVCAEQVLNCVRPGDIVLFHDNHEWIVPILNAVLPRLSRFRVPR